MSKKTLTVELPEAKTASEPAMRLETRAFDLCQERYGKSDRDGQGDGDIGKPDLPGETGKAVY